MPDLPRSRPRKRPTRQCPITGPLPRVVCSCRHPRWWLASSAQRGEVGLHPARHNNLLRNRGYSLSHGGVFPAATMRPRSGSAWRALLPSVSSLGPAPNPGRPKATTEDGQTETVMLPGPTRGARLPCIDLVAIPASGAELAFVLDGPGRVPGPTLLLAGRGGGAR